jgi:hypothetical protein
MGRRDEGLQGRFRCRLAPLKLDVPHPLPASLEEAGGIRQVRSMEETHGRVDAVGGDIGKGCVSDAGRRLVVMKAFNDVQTASANLVEPEAGQVAETRVAGLEPG